MDEREESKPLIDSHEEKPESASLPQTAPPLRRKIKIGEIKQAQSSGDSTRSDDMLRRYGRQESYRGNKAPPDLYYYQAESAMRNKAYKEAFSQYKQSLELVDQGIINPNAYLGCADACFKLAESAYNYLFSGEVPLISVPLRMDVIGKRNINAALFRMLDYGAKALDYYVKYKEATKDNARLNLNCINRCTRIFVWCTEAEHYKLFSSPPKEPLDTVPPSEGGRNQLSEEAEHLIQFLRNQKIVLSHQAAVLATTFPAADDKYKLPSDDLILNAYFVYWDYLYALSKFKNKEDNSKIKTGKDGFIKLKKKMKKLLAREGFEEKKKVPFSYKQQVYYKQAALYLKCSAHSECDKSTCFTEIKALCAQLEALDAQDRHGYFYRACYYAYAGDNEGAIEAFNRAGARYPVDELSKRACQEKEALLEQIIVRQSSWPIRSQSELAPICSFNASNLRVSSTEKESLAKAKAHYEQKKTRFFTCFTQKAIKGDGHCFYRALITGLAHHKDWLNTLIAQVGVDNANQWAESICLDGKENKSLKAYQEAIQQGNPWVNKEEALMIKVRTLRAAVSLYLKDHSDDYVDFLSDFEGGIEAYRKKIEGNGWGGQLELSVLRKLLKCPILSVNKEGFFYPEDNAIFADSLSSDRPPVFLLYNGSDHYDALIVNQQDTSPSVLFGLLKAAHQAYHVYHALEGRIQADRAQHFAWGDQGTAFLNPNWEQPIVSTYITSVVEHIQMRRLQQNTLISSRIAREAMIKLIKKMLNPSTHTQCYLDGRINASHAYQRSYYVVQQAAGVMHALNDAPIGRLVGHLLDYSGLTTLNLYASFKSWGKGSVDQAVYGIVRLISRHGTLESLYLGSNRLTAQDILVLVQGILLCGQRLRTLSLKDNTRIKWTKNLQGETAARALSRLLCFSYLTDLDVSNTRIALEDDAFRVALGIPAPEHTHGSDDEFKAWSSSRSQRAHSQAWCLERLQLGANDLSVLGRNQWLTDLIGAGVDTALHRTLTELDVSHVIFDGTQLNNLFKHLKTNHTLKIVNLAFSLTHLRYPSWWEWWKADYIREQWFNALLSWLKHNKVIKAVNLSNNRLRDTDSADTPSELSQIRAVLLERVDAALKQGVVDQVNQPSDQKQKEEEEQKEHIDGVSASSGAASTYAALLIDLRGNGLKDGRKIKSDELSELFSVPHTAAQREHQILSVAYIHFPWHKVRTYSDHSSDSEKDLKDLKVK